jgi:hypothetical protein
MLRLRFRRARRTFQQVTVQGQLTYRIADPEEGGVAARLQPGQKRAVPCGRAAEAAGAAGEERAGGRQRRDAADDVAGGADERDGDWRGSIGAL